MLRNLKIRAGVLCALLLFAVWPAYAAPSGYMRLPRISPDAPWEVQADVLEHDPGQDVYTATGHVTVTREGRTITADKIIFERANKLLFAEGHVVVKAGGDELAGDALRMDLVSETGMVTQGSLFVKENHFYIRALRITKTGQDTYVADDATVTSCDGSRPDWKITGSQVQVTVDGYGNARDMVLWAKNVPVLYAPYLFFPAKVTRQSGLLYPEFGQSSRKGFFYTQPVYWAISDEQDATFYANIMEKRGVQWGVEWRRIFGKDGKYTLYGTFLDDRQTDTGTPASTAAWGYANDSYGRTNTSRYWLAGKLDNTFASGLKLKADLDVVSDQDYLDDFRKGDIGFDALDTLLGREYGRDLGDYNDPVRTSRLSLDKTWQAYEAFGGMIWNQDPASKWEDQDTALQTLPYAGFSGAWRRLSSTNVFANFETNVSHFYREDLATGNRVDLYPRVFMPIPLAGVAQLEPSAGLRQTFWSVDSWNGDPLESDDKYFSRTLADVNVDLFTEFVRVFGVSWGDTQKLRHSVLPKLSYVYVPETGQDDLPHFDSSDRISKENHITYSLTNSLMAKRLVQSKEGESFDFRRVLWLELSQDYGLDEETSDEETSDGSSRFSPIRAKLEFSPWKMLTLKAETDWSTSENDFTYASASMNLTYPQGHNFTVEYIDSKGFSEYLRVTGRIKASDAWTLYGNYERDLLADQQVESGIGVIYESGCWSLDTGYTDDGEDHQFTFRITLKGLGGVGASAAP